MVQHLNVPALKKLWVLDAQWTDCPEEVERVIKAIWQELELGNDNYMFRRCINDLVQWELTEQQFVPAPELGEGRHKYVTVDLNIQPLIDYLRSRDIPDEEEVIFHWWW